MAHTNSTVFALTGSVETGTPPLFHCWEANVKRA